MSTVQLRALGRITRMQPRYAAYEGTVADGDIPLAGMAQLFAEIAPGNEVYRLMDAVLKATSVRPGSQVVEREFGMLEVHSFAPDDIDQAVEVIEHTLGVQVDDRLRPRVVSERLITNITAYQAQLVNRSRRGSMVIPGDTLLVVECAPAAYVMLAANEAEKAAAIDVVDVRPIGRFGRLYLTGTESEVETARAAAIAALGDITGRDPEVAR